MNKPASKFKIWLLTHNINQTQLSQASDLGITTLHHLINDGITTKRTIRIVTDCLKNKFGIEITEKEIVKMIEK